MNSFSIIAIYVLISIAFGVLFFLLDKDLKTISELLQMFLLGLFWPLTSIGFLFCILDNIFGKAFRSFGNIKIKK